MRKVKRKKPFVCALLLGMIAAMSPNGANGSTTSVTMTPQLVHQLEPYANAVISPNGRLLATLHRGSIYLWDIETGAILRTLSPIGLPKFAFTNDNEHLHYATVSVVNGKPALITGDWNLLTGESAQSPGPAGMFVLAVIPGGKRAILAENPMGTIHVYDIENKKIVRSFGTPPPTGTPATQLDPRTISLLAVAEKGPFVLLYRVNGSIELWDTEHGQLRSIEKNAGASNWITISANGARAAYTHRGPGKTRDELAILDVSSGKQIRTITAGDYGFVGVALSADGKWALTTAPGKTQATFDLWNLETGSKAHSGILDESGMTTTLSFVGQDRFVRGSNNHLDIWDAVQARKERSFVAGKYPIFSITSAGVAPDADWGFGAGSDGPTVRLFSWNLSSLGLGSTHALTSMSAHIAGNTSRAWIPNGNGFTILDLQTLQSRNMMRDAGTTLAGAFVLSGDGQKLISGASRRGSDPISNNSWQEIVLSEWDANSGSKIDKIVRKSNDLSVSMLAASRDGRFVATNEFNGTTGRAEIRLWDLERDVPLHAFRIPKMAHPGAALSDDGQTLALAYMDQKKPGSHLVQVIDVPTGKVRTAITSNIVGLVQSMAFSPAADKLALGCVNVEVFHTATGTLAHTFRGDPQAITSLGFSGHGKYLMTAGRGGTMNVYRLDKPAAVTMIASRGEWLVYDEDGYFDASRKGGMLVAAVDGNRTYNIDQLAVRNNRPDLLLERMGLGDADIIRHFRSRYERRLEKLGISNEAALPSFQTTPEVTITAVDVENAVATVKFDAVARGADLLRYNVFVNDVPIFGALGKPTTGTSQHVEERIELGSGQNKIEVSALDARGGESLRAVRVVERKESVKGNLYYLAFGVSKYKNPKYNLGFPHKDVIDLGDVLRAGAGKAFDQVHVRTYVNDKATVENLKNSKEFLQQATVDDTIVLFIAGHGLHARDAAGDYYFATHEVDPKRLSETAARFEIIEGLLMDIRPRKKLFLMDTCESGEREKDDGPSGGIPANGRSLIARSSRQLEIDTAYADVTREKTAPRRKYYDRERYIYNDLTRRTGAIVISSSRGSESSFELDEIANGVFTEEMLLALTSNRADGNRDGLVSTDELRAHLFRSVPKRTDDQQHPTVDRDNLEARYGFPVVTEAAAIATRMALPANDMNLVETAIVPRETPPAITHPHGCGCEFVEPKSGMSSASWATIVALAASLRRRKARAG